MFLVLNIQYRKNKNFVFLGGQLQAYLYLFLNVKV